jgi:hypothetical protein
MPSSSSGGAAGRITNTRSYSHVEKIGSIPFVYTINRTRDGRIAALSVDVKDAYERDGVVAIRGLTNPKMIERARRESDVLLNPKPRKGGQFHTANHSSLFISDALWDVAVESDIPVVAYQLLQHSIMAEDDGNQRKHHAIITSLRVLRDIFLAKSNEDHYSCGWHVDDFGFWPGTPTSPGINAWIALEENQESLAVAVGSHRASWRHRAYFETGAPIATDFPVGGYANASDYLLRRTGSGTCNIKRAAPDLHFLMEESSRVYTLQPGDVIFHTRWLFHRTEVSGYTREPRGGEHRPRRMERRYSVRYVPGTAMIPPGYGTELSVLWDSTNGGRTVDEVSSIDGPWYPQVWPVVLDGERRGKRALVRDKFAAASERRRLRESEMSSLVRQIARERSGRSS